jgi:serine/threonine protein kinase
VAEDVKTLLVVDDNEDNLDLLTRRFERKGYTVLRASGGKQALALLASKSVDLVVLDVMMPEVTGLDVLRELRTTRSPAELPVIIATAQNESTDVVKALDLGANDHVSKPVNFEVLLARVRAQLRQRESLRAAAASLPPRTGGVIGQKYELKEKLGTGGFGSVYRARHVALDTFVAVKVLHSHLLDSDMTRARFSREGISACRVRHPNAVAVLDAGTTEDGSPYLVMELLEGISLLEELAREDVLRVRRAAEVVHAVCEVLEVAHAAGVIHRDVKPANIMLAQTPRGELVKVLDFGIARLLDEVLEGPVTAGDQVVGTPHYMAPERLLGRPADERSDVYSVGAMLYQMLCGRLPYGGGSATPLGQALRQLQSSAVPVEKIRPDVPPALAEVTMRCLDADALRRPTVPELAACLRDAFGHEEPHWPPTLIDVEPGRSSLPGASGDDTTIAMPSDEASAVKATGGQPLEEHHDPTREGSPHGKRKRG